MDLLKEIIIELICKKSLSDEFKNIENRLVTGINQECYQALIKIKAIIEDEALDFDRVHEISRVFQELGSDVPELRQQAGIGLR